MRVAGYRIKRSMFMNLTHFTPFYYCTSSVILRNPDIIFDYFDTKSLVSYERTFENALLPFRS